MMIMKYTDEQWLWCLHCERFFQHKDLIGEDCPLPNCNGAGLELDIFSWDSWPQQNPELKKHWPKSTNELKKELHCPLY